MSPLPLGRKPLRTYVFIIVFACTLAAFTLGPISIPKSAGSAPLEAQKTLPLHIPFRHTPLRPDLAAAEPEPAADSEFELHPDPPPSTHRQPQPMRPAHTFRPDGLLQVNLDGRHPILDLIDRAEHEWKAKLARASRTLPEAVREYNRRYGRAPPPGFDKWWSYIVRHEVQLPDEYDQINQDLAPLWGIEPTQLQTIQRDWESRAYSYTVAKTSPSGLFYLANESMPDDENERRRLIDNGFRLVNLMAEVEEDLPLFRAVFSPDDNPAIFLTEEMKSRAIEAGKLGDYIDIDQHPPHASGWLRACHPDSIANRASPLEAEAEAETPKSKTFIYDHLLAMDPCIHPSLLSQHGQFLSHHEGPGAYRHPIPHFSYCSTMLHSDIRVPHPGSWMDDVEGEGGVEGMWENREDDRLLWRGMNTGIYHSRETSWRNSHRDRLMEMAQRPVGNTTILVSNTNDDGEDENIDVECVKKARLNNALLDIAFAGGPNQCEPETCAELDQLFDWRRPMSIRAAGKYKYVLDVDGNGWSSRFKRLMTTRALVFKSTIYPEWFTDRLAPWVHYVPIQNDYSDLYDALVFFQGDLAGRGAHEELAARIGQAGREWSLTFWREEDTIAYLFRLFLEYARVMSEDREDLNFELEDYI